MAPSYPTAGEIAIGVVWTFVFPRPLIARLGPRGLVVFVAGLTAFHYVGRTMWPKPVD